MYIKCENDSWEHIMDSLRSDERTTPINEEIKNMFEYWCTKCKYGKCTGVRHSPCANCSVAIDYALGHISKSIPSEYSYDLSHLDKLPTLYERYCGEFPDHLTVGDFGLPSICPDELGDYDAKLCSKDNPEDCNECMDCWAKFGYDSPYRHANCNGVYFKVKMSREIEDSSDAGMHKVTYDGVDYFEKNVDKEKQVNGIKDSGDRTEFATGAVRDIHAGKGRFDLLPWHAIWDVAKHCENGAFKYGERNVNKGIPQHSLIDSAYRHMTEYLLGFKDEEHLRAACWNLLWALEQCTTHPELLDIPWKDEEVVVVAKYEDGSEWIKKSPKPSYCDRCEFDGFIAVECNSCVDGNNYCKEGK